MTTGRPTLYTQDLADRICQELSEGRSLRSICLQDDLPDARTVFRWLRTNAEFCQQYARAKEESTDAMSEDILALSDGAIDVIKGGAEKKSSALGQAVRLQVDTRKWIMSKMKPKKYGDKLDMTSDGKAITVELISYAKPKPADNTATEPAPAGTA
jgi:hypothetical protein